MAFFIALVVSYLVGSFPTAYVFVKALKRVDVRMVGSGNVGATNVARVAGWKAGVAVFLIDLGKGLAAVVWIAPWFLHPLAPAMRLACGLAAVIGHNFPFALGFRGGKGVATTIGVLMGAMPMVAAAYGLVWLVVFGVSRYVSAASLAAAAAIPIAQGIAQRERAEIVLGCCLALLIVVRHRTNIERLVHGTEHRVGPRRS